MPTHYEVLGIPASKTLTPQLLKAAYRRALLQHHPDKSLSTPAPAPTPTPKTTQAFSIDQITTAYSILLSPKSKAEYDREIALSASAQQGGREGEVFRTGVEVVDLEDLGEEVDGRGESVWFRGCRCGDERGFVVREADLEEASGEGELYAGCAGCSLWLKVLFGVVEDGEGEGKR